MYRRPKFLEVLHTIREEMSREADYDVDLFAEMVRSGAQPQYGPERVIRGFRTRAPKKRTPTVRRQNVDRESAPRNNVATNFKTTDLENILRYV
jgi:hypothetical protein